VLINNGYFVLPTFLCTRRCAKTQGQLCPDGKHFNIPNYIISLLLWTPLNAPQMKTNLLLLVSVVNPHAHAHKKWSVK